MNHTTQYGVEMWWVFELRLYDKMDTQFHIENEETERKKNEVCKHMHIVYRCM